MTITLKPLMNRKMHDANHASFISPRIRRNWLLLATVNLFHIQSVGIRVPLGRSDVSNSHVKTTDIDGDRLAWRFFLFFGRFVLLGWLGLLFLHFLLLFLHFLFLHLLLSFHRSCSRSRSSCCWMRKNF